MPPTACPPCVLRSANTAAARTLAAFEKSCFDLTQLDAETAQLHLIIKAAQIFDIAVSEKARPVARLVQTCVWIFVKTDPE